MPQAEKLCGLIEEKQTMLNVADSQTIELTIDGQRFSMFEGTVLESSRSLDMEKGVTVRQVIWRSPAGHEVEICIRRMTSFELLELFTIEYTVKACLLYTSQRNGQDALLAEYEAQFTNQE